MYGTLQTPVGVYVITQLFGMNPDMYARYGLKGHNGVDVVGPGGERKNICWQPGLVTIAGPYGAYGDCVRVKGDDGNEWTYGHFESIDHNVKVGQRVEMWQYLGVQGKSGYATGVHDHIGVRPLQGMDVNNGYKGAIDPLPILRKLETNQINNDDMTTEEKQQLNAAYNFVQSVIKALNPMSQVQGAGNLVYDAIAANKDPKTLKGICADSQVAAALLAGIGASSDRNVMITKEESKNEKYVPVHTVREVLE